MSACVGAQKGRFGAPCHLATKNVWIGRTTAAVMPRRGSQIVQETPNRRRLEVAATIDFASTPAKLSRQH
jgi:hypothetical protein